MEMKENLERTKREKVLEKEKVKAAITAKEKEVERMREIFHVHQLTLAQLEMM